VPEPPSDIHPGFERPLNPLTRAIWGAATPTMKRLGVFRPKLLDFWAAARTMSADPDAILAGWNGANAPPRDELLEEYRQVVSTISTRAGGSYSMDTIPMAVTRGEGFLLYALTRIRRPKLVVETGVANGVSTMFLLSALRRNGVGRLLSFDVDPTAGSLVRPEDRGSWRFAVVPHRGGREFFVRELEREGPIDCFIHDSDHSFPHQWFEFRTAFPRVIPGGLFASDDADWSFAYLDFCAQHGMTPDVLIASMKLFGVAEVPKR
jgi:predicted O-methyltransferase YrrM